MTESQSQTVESTSQIGNVISQHQIAAFAAVTLTISWGWWGIAVFVLGSGDLSQGLMIPGAFGPPIAAALVTWASGGNLRRWFSQLAKWRVALRWYLIAIGLPVVAALGGVGGALVISGGPLEPTLLSERLPLFAFALVFAALLGGGQEELGWRGFALPRLEERYTALSASIVIGIIWAVWHAPLFLLGEQRNQTGSFVLYAVLVVGLSILLTWCYNSTSGSVLLAMLFHGSVNASGNIVPVPIEAVDQWPLVIDIGMIAGVWLIAALVTIWGGMDALSRRNVPDPAIAGVRRTSQ